MGLFVAAKDPIAFVMCFDEYQVTIAGLRRCFVGRRGDGGARARRERACCLLASICRCMVSVLELTRFREMQITVNGQCALHFMRTQGGWRCKCDQHAGTCLSSLRQDKLVVVPKFG